MDPPTHEAVSLVILPVKWLTYVVSTLGTNVRECEARNLIAIGKAERVEVAPIQLRAPCGLAKLVARPTPRES